MCFKLLCNLQCDEAGGDEAPYPETQILTREFCEYIDFDTGEILDSTQILNPNLPSAAGATCTGCVHRILGRVPSTARRSCLVAL